MSVVLASFGLDAWGQVAAIILALSLFISIILGLALAAALMFGFAWIREKAEMLRNLPPFVNKLNRGLSASQHGDPLPQETADNKLVQAANRVLPRMTKELPVTASAIEEKVEHGSDRVASAVIEFQARTAMVKGIAKAFFMPSPTRPRPTSRPLKEIPAPAQEHAEVATEELNKAPVYEQEMTIAR